MDREKAKIKAKVYLQHLSKKGYKCEERNCDAELQSKMNCMAYIISDNKGDRFATVTADFNAIGFMLEYAITEDEKKYKSNLFNMINDLNKIGIVRYTIFLDHPTTSDRLFLSAFYMGEYNKQLFDYFLDECEYGSKVAITELYQVFADYSPIVTTHEA